MASELRLDYEGIESSRVTLETEKGTFDTSYQTMKACVEALPDVWSGDTCEKYVQQFHDLESSFNSISDLIEGLYTQLGKISSNFSEADSGMAGQVGV